MTLTEEISQELQDSGFFLSEAFIQEAVSSHFFQECAEKAGQDFKTWLIQALTGEF
jgi:hypothetical protein